MRSAAPIAILVPMPISCLIADDNAAFLMAARGLLERQGIDIAGTARTSAECLNSAKKLAPQVVLVDINLGDDDGFDLARQLRAQPVAPEVILISTYDEQEYAEAIAASDAVGFLTKSMLSASALETLLGRDFRVAEPTS